MCSGRSFDDVLHHCFAHLPVAVLEYPIILAAVIIASANATVTIANAAVLFLVLSFDTLFFVFIVVTVISSSYYRVTIVKYITCYWTFNLVL